MRISDWSSDVCSSDLVLRDEDSLHVEPDAGLAVGMEEVEGLLRGNEKEAGVLHHALGLEVQAQPGVIESVGDVVVELAVLLVGDLALRRSEEHTSELQSLMRISYAVFCLKKQKQHKCHRRLL